MRRKFKMVWKENKQRRVWFVKNKKTVTGFFARGLSPYRSSTGFPFLFIGLQKQERTWSLSWVSFRFTLCFKLTTTSFARPPLDGTTSWASRHLGSSPLLVYKINHPMLSRKDFLLTGAVHLSCRTRFASCDILKVFKSSRASQAAGLLWAPK